MVHFNANLIRITVLGAGVQILAGVAAGVASVKRSRGCLMPDTADSSQFHLTLLGAQLRSSAKMMPPLGVFKKGEKCCL